MATFKHISSKNADYGAAEAYLTFEHDEFTMKPTLDENGRLIPREDYRISSLNCGGEDFAVACMRANLRYEKNQKREDVKSHHYIISFDPRDGTDNGLTVDRAQELGEQFCKEHFPGHQALVCTHPDGHNHSGNIHVHIVINSLRIYEVPLLPYMDRPADTREGCKHRCTNAAMEYFKSEVMEMCHREGLYQIDLLNGSKERITEREYWAAKKGQLALDKENATREAAGQPTKDTIPELCELAASALPFSVAALSVDASRIINNGKVSDHHALLPTKQISGADLSSLPAGERNILTLVTVRLLCAVGEKHLYEDTAVVLLCGGATFTAKGRVVVSPGFKEIEQAFFATLKKKPEDDSKDEDAKALPPLAEGQTFEKVEASTKEGTTSPPRHFTEDLLLSAMEHASAEEFAEIEGAERTGLGTPATRAGVLEKLVRGGFLERKGRQLLPTKKGFNLIVVLPDSVKSARLTAQWEAGLKSVERGEQAPDAFMGGIEQMVSDLVAQYSAVKADTSLFQQREVIGKCPRCGSDVLEGKKNFYCSNRECQFSMWKDDRFFTSKHKELTKPMAAALLKNGRIKMKGLFSEKKGVLYDAVVVLADTGEKYVNYKIELPPRPKTKGKE